MKQEVILVLITLALLLPMVHADIIIQLINETSQAKLSPGLNLDLINATVIINATGSYPSLGAIFIVHSNEKDIVNASVYLRAKGQRCYNGVACISEDSSREVSFQIRYKEAVVDRGCDWMIPHHPFLNWSSYYACNIYSNDYNTSEGIFQKTEPFLIYPNETFVLHIEEHDLYLPFEYYLDSLSTFNKADYEKITIYGNVSATFNDKYPVKKISDSERVWEYSNLNIKDPNLKGILTITSYNSSIEPNETFFQKILNWFGRLFGLK